MDIKLEGRQVEIGDELKERINKRMDNLNSRFGPITHARVSIERKSHNNEQRAEVKGVINVPGGTLTATKESGSVVPAVNDMLDALAMEMQTWAEKNKKNHR
ncbi:HPF/RaiA family ribosome-associated protein [Magnetofaba australis]|uniref:Putative sigma 54 modulation protein/ribosomal protein S30EA n=1 Tax=Magnetofaba australis IT-1 TaxID=1434232 RepID=A0A1Y2K354_9PROT|nr:HPF/RaiA family ribosome-associated protein [Magnetofaba australis]OSM02056.1 putative sigma 54 modulation protein/ribosomal protein S30EA [Magnetofaba australis IT-1]